MNTRVSGLCLLTIIGLSIGPAHADLSTNLAPSADTTLFQHNPDNNLGSNLTVVAGTIGLGDRSRALFKFDVANALPTNATITSATLALTVAIARGEGQDYALHRIEKNWSEGIGFGGGTGGGVLGAPANNGETTWNARLHGSALWDAPGGQTGSDYAPTPSAVATMGTSSMVFATPGLVANVQAWLDDPGTNFGWVLMVQDEAPLAANASHISSRENSAAAPVLTIQYTVPAPPAPPTLTTISLTNSAFQFRFNAETNYTYTVQFSGDLGGTNWNSLTNLAPLPAPQEVVISDPLTASNRFYRVQVH